VDERATPPVLSRSDVASGISLESLIPEIERGFRAFHEGRAPISPVASLHLPEVRGETHIRAGYFSDGEIVCVKVANFYFDNPSKGLPTMDCVIVVSARHTGRIRALICDGGLLSDLRTAAASAVAANALSRRDATTVGLIGAGNQAYWHARALCVVRPVRRIKVWSRNEKRAASTADRLRSNSVDAAAATLEDAAACDIVVTATPARSPVLDEQRLAPGACVIAMGADTPGKRELGPSVLRRAECIVADSLPQARRAGELQWHSAAREGQTISDLGSVLSGSAVPRVGEAPVVFDSTGIAFQDVVAASLLLKKLGKAVTAGPA